MIFLNFDATRYDLEKYTAGRIHIKVVKFAAMKLSNREVRGSIHLVTVRWIKCYQRFSHLK